MRLKQIADIPTYNYNTLDQFIINRPDQLVVLVAQSLVKTKHTALIINSKADYAQTVARHQRITVTILDRLYLLCCGKRWLIFIGTVSLLP